MNYIKKLEADQAAADQAVKLALEQLNDFRTFLLRSPKFQGFESDGSRRDWISVGDVVRWVDGLRGEIIERAPERALTRGA